MDKKMCICELCIKRRAYYAKWRDKNPDYDKTEKRVAYRRAWYQKNKERLNAKHKRVYDH